ncbi:MAG: RNA polymerase sigma factor [Rubrivivax sp.]|nr:RNA polymerase sigma factor [Rubrivivax sp.]
MPAAGTSLPLGLNTLNQRATSATPFLPGMMFFAPMQRTRLRPSAPEVAEEGSTTALWQRLCEGDVGALESLYRREAALVYRYALALTGNAAWAADATQEAFVALAQRPQGFDPQRGALGAYLAGVARHALAARWRELKREMPLEPAQAEAEGDGTETSAGSPGPGAGAWEGAAGPEALLVRRQEITALWAALAALPPMFREAVVLVDLQERPYAEAAQIAGVELNTLRTRLHRGRVRLAALLGGLPADQRSSR